MLKIVSAINTQQQAGARAPSSARKWQNKTRAELCQILIEIGLRLESEDKLVKIRSSWTTDRSLNSTLDPSATSGRKNVSGPVMNLRLSDRSKEVTALLTIGFLIQMYKVDQWYFEIVNMIYKLLLTSVVTFLADDEPSKVAIGWIINFLFSSDDLLETALQQRRATAGPRGDVPGFNDGYDAVDRLIYRNVGQK